MAAGNGRLQLKPIWLTERSRSRQIPSARLIATSSQRPDLILQQQQPILIWNRAWVRDDRNISRCKESPHASA